MKAWSATRRSTSRWASAQPALAKAGGAKEVLGLWLEQNEGAKFWLRVMNELRNRGVDDILLAVVDGLKGFPDAITARYIRYAANGVPLPAETVAYTARLGGATGPAIAAIPLARWQKARLFLDLSGGDGEAADAHTLKLATATKEEGTSPTSVAAQPRHDMVATLLPLSSEAAPAQR